MSAIVFGFWIGWIGAADGLSGVGVDASDGVALGMTGVDGGLVATSVAASGVGVVAGVAAGVAAVQPEASIRAATHGASRVMFIRLPWGRPRVK